MQELKREMKNAYSEKLFLKFIFSQWMTSYFIKKKQYFLKVHYLFLIKISVLIRWDEYELNIESELV